mgnify:CR=1 FL=1
MQLTLNEINFLIFLLFFIALSFFFNTKNIFFILIFSELFWITLYFLVLVLSFFLNNIYILSLSLFFLIFSAIEISTGISIILLQQNSFNNLKLFKNNFFKNFKKSNFFFNFFN